VTSFIRPVCDEYGIGRKEYKRLLHLSCGNTDIRMIRKSTRCGKPLGPENFIKNITSSLGIKIPLRTRGRPRKNIK
jgi:hypothetical protein